MLRTSICNAMLGTGIDAWIKRDMLDGDLSIVYARFPHETAGPSKLFSRCAANAVTRLHPSVSHLITVLLLCVGARRIER